MVCASLGMAIVFVVPGTLWLKFVIAYAVSQIILLVRTVFEKTSVCNRISYQPLERQQESRVEDLAPKYLNRQVDSVACVEDNMHTYRYGEILCTAAVLVKIYHVLQGYDSQLERTIYFLMECNCQICPTIIREGRW